MVIIGAIISIFPIIIAPKQMNPVTIVIFLRFFLIILKQGKSISSEIAYNNLEDIAKQNNPKNQNVQ